MFSFPDVASLLAGQVDLRGQVQEQNLKDPQEQLDTAETFEINRFRLFVGKTLCSIRRLPSLVVKNIHLFTVNYKLPFKQSSKHFAKIVMCAPSL